MRDHIGPVDSHRAQSPAFCLAAWRPRAVGVEAVCHTPAA